MIKTLNKRQMKMNKGRSMMAILAIALTCLLLTSVITIGSHMMQAFQYSTAKEIGTLAHGGFQRVEKEIAEDVIDHPLIKEYARSTIIGLVEDDDYMKRMCEVRTMDESFMALTFGHLIEGRLPVAYNEIVVDQPFMTLNKKQHKVGDKITLTLSIGEVNYDETFEIVGISSGNLFAQSSFMIVSDDFKSAYVSEEIGPNELGAVDVLVNFNSKFNIENKLFQILEDKDYDVEEISIALNWAYDLSFMSMNTNDLVAYCVFIVMLMLSGYLIIYNIFYIGVTKDIRFYGLLKTIGMTSKQINRMVLKQGVIYALIAMPFGFGLGFLFSMVLVPVIMDSIIIGGIPISPTPLIFIVSGFLTLITTLISCRKPGKIAAKVSPIEALRSYDITYTRKNRQGYSSKMSTMAWRNVFMNRKKAILVILSLAFSITIFLGVGLLTQNSIDNDNLDRMIQTDYIVANDQYFRYRYNENIDSFSVPEVILELDQELHPIYYKEMSMQVSDEQERKLLELNDDETGVVIFDGLLDVEAFSIDNFTLRMLDSKVVSGNIPTSLKANEIILNQKIFTQVGYNVLPFKAGDQLEIDGELYTIVATIHDVEQFLFDQSTRSNQLSIYSQSLEGHIMNVLINGELDKELLSALYPKLTIKTRQDYIDDNKKFENMIMYVGYTLSSVLFLIGLINFINMQATSVIIRKKMFAVLESVGMKKRQLKQMLSLESLIIIGLAFIVGTCFSLGLSLLTLGSIKIAMTVQLFGLISVLLLIVLLLPIIVYNVFNKSTVVERLRGDD